MKSNLLLYKKEMEDELNQILYYWAKFTVDEEYGGYYGKVDNENIPYPKSPKGIVLNSRILWSFCAGFNYLKKKECIAMAERAYRYIVEHFFDREFGGVFWSLDHKGNILNDHKQIYGLAFCIYGLSEFYKAKKEQEALDLAITLFKLIEKYSFDKKRLGYYEAFGRNWQPLEDVRLSEKDANEKKTMNTHLHVIEAYVNLYEIWPDDFLKTQIENLLEVFHTHFIDKKSGHLILFFDEAWNRRSGIISYGHDIEASWLLLQCAEKIKNEDWITKMKVHSVKITNAVIEGIDEDGGLWYEYDIPDKKLIREKHSWPQAEAMIGFMNSYEITGDEKYFERSFNSWQFIKQYIKDKRNGEWFWGVTSDHSIMQNQDKAGFWKCPYHNTRACLEIIHRISSLLNRDFIN